MYSRFHENVYDITLWKCDFYMKKLFRREKHATLTSHHQECFPFLDGNNKYGSHGHSHHRAAAYLRCPHYDKTGNSVILNELFM